MDSKTAKEIGDKVAKHLIISHDHNKAPCFDGEVEIALMIPFTEHPKAGSLRPLINVEKCEEQEKHVFRIVSDWRAGISALIQQVIQETTND